MALPAKRGEQEARATPARWDPFRELEEMRDRLERLFEGFAPSFQFGREVAWTPLADVEETDDAWLIELDLPGLRREDVTIEVADSELGISGEVTERERTGVLRRRTRRSGSFEFRMTLPSRVDTERIEAQLEHGVLSVSVPKAEEARRRRIELKGG